MNPQNPFNERYKQIVQNLLNNSAYDFNKRALAITDFTPEGKQIPALRLSMNERLRLMNLASLILPATEAEKILAGLIHAIQTKSYNLTPEANSYDIYKNIPGSDNEGPRYHVIKFLKDMWRAIKLPVTWVSYCVVFLLIVSGILIITCLILGISLSVAVWVLQRFLA
jgi:hypothetical protein